MTNQKSNYNIYLLVSLVFIILLGGIGAYYYFKEDENSEEKQDDDSIIINQHKEMELKSSAFNNNEKIPSKYTCDGENISPPLEISNVPEGTKSLVLIVNDPDAPVGDWIHWTVWNIPPAVSLIEENFVPSEVIEGVTDFGKPGYGGPCPPSGTHRYYFRIYALDTLLDFDESASASDIKKAMEGHVLDEGELMGEYSRD